MQCTRNVSILLLSVIILIAITSCRKGEETVQINEREVERFALEILDKGPVILALDHETDFQHLANLQLIEVQNKEYLSFYNRNTHSIYLYDYETKGLIKRIQLAKEGPNTVGIFSTINYFFHTLDSIFIRSMFHGSYLINTKAEVLQKRPDAILAGTKNDGYLDFDLATRFIDNQIHCRIRYGALNIKDGALNSRVVIDMTSDSLLAESINERSFIKNYDAIRGIEKEKGKSLIRMDQHFARDNDYIYASTPISDSIYVFKGDQLVNTIYTGVPDFEIADYRTYMDISEIEYFKGGVQRTAKPVQPPQFIGMFIDPAGEFIYRVLAHGTKPLYDENLKEDRPLIFGATLIIVNVKTEEMTSFELPVDEIELQTNIFSGNVFVSKKGIHFRVKDQENEDEVRFRVFGLKEQ